MGLLCGAVAGRKGGGGLIGGEGVVEHPVPQGAHAAGVFGDLFAVHPRSLVVETQAVLEATVFPIGVGDLRGVVGGDQSEFAGHLQERDVAQVAGQAGVFEGVAEDEVLDDELDIDEAAAVVFEIE